MECNFDIVVAMRGARLNSFEISIDSVSLKFFKPVDDLEWKFIINTNCLVTSTLQSKIVPTEIFPHDLELLHSILDKCIIGIWQIDKYSCKLKFESEIELFFTELYRDEYSELMVIHSEDWPNSADKFFATI